MYVVCYIFQYLTHTCSTVILCCDCGRSVLQCIVCMHVNCGLFKSILNSRA